MKSKNPTAGSAEPSWFEWQIGLLRLIEMLDEDSEVVAVGFQLHGTKGWDDVGIRFKDGTTQLLQMKHSRSGDTLTFGDLISSDEHGNPSLLRSLARAWKDEYAVRGEVQCILVTNREPGPNWYNVRPPLAEFFSRIKDKSENSPSINAMHWTGLDAPYHKAWQLFLSELSDLQLDEQLKFIVALELETRAPDLAELDSRLYQRLQTLTGLTQSSVRTLFNALHAQLRKWTSHTRREFEWIDREELRACLTDDDADPPWLGHCEVETPVPFLPSRIPLVTVLNASLLSQSSHKIDFLSAEPGSGKTSCASKLSRSGAEHWHQQCISVRFYAYRPIRPGHPDVGSDAAGVRPDSLWLGLLWQIRDNLRRTHLLSELHVPVWLEGMSWQLARQHVLRLASALGQRWNRPFVICIDGIDHAARARRNGLPQFLETLPTPDAIPSYVRFFLAGQPVESYPEYPFFLRHPRSAVKIHTMDELTDEDLRVLWRAANPKMVLNAESAVLRLIADKTRRRTLPVIYAVEDIRDSTSLNSAAAILEARPLPDSLNNYYDAIWSSATITAGNDYRLAAAFALLRERPTAELMATAFHDVGKSCLEWKDLLRQLRPLVRESPLGFELVHNDLRVHLEARLFGDPVARRDAADALASYYRRPASSRLASHRSLLDLLVTAERENDFADDFTVDWVIEAGSLGVSGETLPRECSAAFRAAIARKDWLLLHKIGCAALTLHRLNECMTEWARDDDPIATRDLPTFLSVEGEPTPLDFWTFSTFSNLIGSSQYLVERGATQRAAIVLRQWIGGVPLEALIQKVLEARDIEYPHGDSDDALRRVFEQFGRLCATTGVLLAQPEECTSPHSDHIADVEVGWALGLNERADRRNALRLWCSRQPRHLPAWVATVKSAGSNERWGEVRALLKRMEHLVDNIAFDDRVFIALYAARAKANNISMWSKVLIARYPFLPREQVSLTIARTISQWSTYVDPLREPAQVADELFSLLDLRNSELKKPSAVKLLLRASAVIGRMLRYWDRGDIAGVAIAIPSTALAPYLESLWCQEPDWTNLPHEELSTPGEIGRTLSEIAWACGSHYRKLLHSLALSRFKNIMLGRDGIDVFQMLWELGEFDFLEDVTRRKVDDVLAHLHEEDASSRNSGITNLLHFAQRLKIGELEAQLVARLGRTRLGYGSHKEWVFHPLVRWFEIIRKLEPSRWMREGMQLLALDRIAEQQGADNRLSEELTAEVGAAAMQCDSDNFEALADFLICREAKNPLWDLSSAVKNGFQICLRENAQMGDESVLARVAVAIAVGRWPKESPLATVSELLTTYGIPPTLSQQPAWDLAVRIAAEIQGLPATIIEKARENYASETPEEALSAEELLSRLLDANQTSGLRLSQIAALAERARIERHRDRDGLVSRAIDALESSEAFSRWIEHHDIQLVSRLHENLSESEFWRLLDAITAITGEIRTQLSDARWAFTAAFSAVNLACRAHSVQTGREFSFAIFHQLLDMHWKWHGVPAPSTVINIPHAGSSWPDVARRILISLSQTDGCETLYKTMSGMRFFATAFPEQIPALCSEGLTNDRARAAILPLAQLWATHVPAALGPALPEFHARETTGTLDDRLDAWIVGALSNVSTGKRPVKFKIPQKSAGPDIAFPGDEQLFEADVDTNGLMRHNSFGRMANERLRRAAIELGSMESAFRFLVRRMRESNDQTHSFYFGPPKRLIFDQNFPRPSNAIDNFVGEAIMHQCAAEEWSSFRASAVRQLMSYGMDPWIASATPNPWHTESTWPDGFDVERWFEERQPTNSEVSNQIEALIEGGDLAPDLLLLGAVLRIPTYRRDVEYRYWLAAPRIRTTSENRLKSSTPTARTFAHWLTGWSFATTQTSTPVSVHFPGTLVNYPNSELEVTPTDQWNNAWHWSLDTSNALRFRAPDGAIAAWYERWIGPDSPARRIWRQPFLSRWVAKRSSLPSEVNELRSWTRHRDVRSGLVSDRE